MPSFDPMKVLTDIQEGKSSDESLMDDSTSSSDTDTSYEKKSCSAYSIVRFESSDAGQRAIAAFAHNSKCPDFETCGTRSISVRAPTKAEMIRATCADGVSSPIGDPRLDPCDLLKFNHASSHFIYRVMSVNRTANTMMLDRPMDRSTQIAPKGWMDAFKVHEKDLAGNGKLEELAKEKLLCTSLLCISEIEAKERMVNFEAGSKRILQGAAGHDDANLVAHGSSNILPALRTKETCRQEELEAVSSSDEVAAMPPGGLGSIDGGASMGLKDYEDMGVPKGGNAWPGVDDNPRQDTMEYSGGLMAFHDRL